MDIQQSSHDQALLRTVVARSSIEVFPQGATIEGRIFILRRFFQLLFDMQLAQEIDVINAQGVKDHPLVASALRDIRSAISHVVWPTGSKRFTIYPESGKKAGMGNGVGPIKGAFLSRLVELGWDNEQPFPLESVPGGSRFGKLDAGKLTPEGVLAVEWETGNISSSHRSMNKMSLGLKYGVLLAGVLIVPTKDLAKYLTDRIGNLYELLAYVRLWESIPVDKGYLGIFAVEHDDTSMSVPRILKGTDGRALR